MDSSDAPKKTGARPKSKLKKDFLTVGIGASAGGINALKEFFAAMPPESGMAFVVVLHLSQTHESNLAGILQRETRMPVLQVGEATRVEPDHVYVIPPAKGLEMVDGVVRLTDRTRPRGQRVIIDRFFSTLANANCESAVGIVLSGAGEDGTLGIKKIKELNGFAIAQKPEDAEFDQMPRSAIKTGLIDWVLPVKQMPEKLLSLRQSTEDLKITVEDDGDFVEELKGAEALRDILTILRIRTGHDFLNYKRPTMLRRIARHLQIHELPDLPSYAKFLRENPDEAELLLKNLLINVTSFFRDKHAFEKLAADVIPRLFAGKTSEDEIRIWSAGCATGEEAYSVAMLLQEYTEKIEDVPKIKIFASDVDDEAVLEGREGLYPEGIINDVSPERLKRFFIKEGKKYRIKNELRETVLFASHNVLRDPPFSRLDLILCRNLMIYLNRETQERLMQLFHFALRADGILFLGGSETADSVPLLFSPFDKIQRIYLRRPTSLVPQQPLSLPSHGKWKAQPALIPPHAESRGVPFGELHFQLLEKIAPPSVLVNEEYDIVHLSENAGRFLQFTGGEPTNNLLKVVKEDLRADLRSALFTAKQEHERVTIRSISAQINGDVRFVNLTVEAFEAPDAAGDFLLVLFEQTTTREHFSARGENNGSAAEKRVDAATQGAPDVLARNLEDELKRTKDRLRATVEQYETSIEELKAANEELQAINEELRCATEELETSKEELQSVNEELTTVNAELKEKIDEISHINADWQNLMHSIDVGVIFLDRNLKIKRFTPIIQGIFNVIETDVGRPLEHLTQKLNYKNFSEDANQVLQNLRTVEREVQSEKGQIFLARLLPYRSLEEKIDGVVLTFTDITEHKSLEEEKIFLASIVESSEDSVVTVDFNGKITSWNKAAESLYGYPALEVIGKSVKMLMLPEDLKELLGDIDKIKHHQTVEIFDSFQLRKGGRRINLEVVMSPLKNASGHVIGVSIIARNISESRKAENELRKSEERLRRIVESLEDYAIITLTPDNKIDSWNPGAERIMGYVEDEVLGESAEIIFTPEDRENREPEKEIQTAIETGSAADERWHLRKDGSQFYASGVLNVLGDSAENGFVKILRDLTERKQFEEALREGDRRKDEFIATLAHELRNPLAPIRTALEIMKAGADQEKAVQAREIIERQTNQLVHLVDDLLDISRITQGKIKLRKERINIANPIAVAIETVYPFVESLRHRLDARMPDAAVFVEADSMRLTQIVLNLLHNSAKYTEPGGHILIIAAREDEEAVIRIRDNGIGIQFELLPKVFDMFTQTAMGEKRGQGGLGIGLSLVKKLVEMHGGTVEAHSEGEGKGSEFVVRLPLAANQKTERKKEKQVTEMAPTQTKAGRILVVDDNADAANMLDIFLSMENRETRTAFTGLEALRVAEQFQPETVILDIGLPDIDGYEVARRLKERFPNICLIALSGWGQEDDRIRSSEAGFDHHLVKPVDVEELKKFLCS